MQQERKRVTTVMLPPKMEAQLLSWADAHSVSKSAAIRYMVSVFLGGDIGKSKDVVGKSND